ncbi:MAG: formylmethanofuran dehydrogenase subunit E family protein [Bacteroidales bacterium]|nr:formylmethanofuran dehydrogenase subunit E family protein [Bacteroidales bacterium]
MVGALTSFEIPLSQYADDVQRIIGTCLARHGEREWKAVVLTHEIHGHLGIYSTLGAKMGLLARERFEAAGCRGDIAILSFAGSVPPVSCFNDGLQVSTGATVGHGLFTVSPEEEKRVEARFRCEGKQLALRLKPQYAQRIRDDIETGMSRYGHAPAYWAYVRELALRYWQDWDRNEIFEEV